MSRELDTILTGPSSPGAILTLTEVKDHVRVTHDDDNAYLSSLIAAVTMALNGPSGMTGRALVAQSWTLRRWPLMGKTRLVLPVVPFRSVASITYRDGDNAERTADLADFVIIGGEDRAYVEPRWSWPAMSERADALTVVWEAGYGGAEAIPDDILIAAKMLVAHWYENREAVVTAGGPAQMPYAVAELLSLRRLGWMAS